MKALLAILSLVLPIVMFGKTLNKQEVYLSKDKTKVSLIEITETHEGNRTTIVADTIKNLYPSENAKAYMTQRNAEILMSESHMVWLPDSLVPRKTHLFGQDRYEKYSLEIEGDKIFHYFKGYYYKPINKGQYYFSLGEAIVLMLVSLLCVLMSTTKSIVNTIRIMCVVIFVTTFIAYWGIAKNFPFIDSFILNFIAVAPAFFVTFLFNKRIRKLEAKKA